LVDIEAVSRQVTKNQQPVRDQRLWPVSLCEFDSKSLPKTTQLAHVTNANPISRKRDGGHQK